jgi:sporulation protein YlmC with PRC-barrel domain
VDALPPFVAENYTTTPPIGYEPLPGMPAAGVYWPVASAGLGIPAAAEPGLMEDSETRQEVDAARRQQDVENAVVKEGSAVRSRDGQTVGHVHQLTFDPRSGRLTRLVVRAGLFGSEERELPTSLIAGVDDGVIYLAVTADELTAHAQ